MNPIASIVLYVHTYVHTHQLCERACRRTESSSSRCRPLGGEAETHRRHALPFRHAPSPPRKIPPAREPCVPHHYNPHTDKQKVYRTCRVTPPAYAWSQQSHVQVCPMRNATIAGVSPCAAQYQ